MYHLKVYSSAQDFSFDYIIIFTALLSFLLKSEFYLSFKSIPKLLTQRLFFIQFSFVYFLDLSFICQLDL